MLVPQQIAIDAEGGTASGYYDTVTNEYLYVRFDPESGASWVQSTGGASYPADEIQRRLNAAPPYNGAGAYSSYFSKPNDFDKKAFYGWPGSVGLMLRDAANAVGMPSYDFNLAAYLASPGYGWPLPGASGWLLGANEEMIYRNIMIATGVPEFISFAAQRSQAAYDAGAAAGIQRDVELAKQNAQSRGVMGDLLTIAAIAGAIYGAYSLYSLASTTLFSAPVAAAPVMDAGAFIAAETAGAGVTAAQASELLALTSVAAPMDAGAFLASETAGAGVSAEQAAQLLSLSSTTQTAGQIAQAMQNVPLPPSTPAPSNVMDAGQFLASETSGAGVSATEATKLLSLSGSPFALPSLSTVASGVKAALPLVKLGAGAIAALMTGSAAKPQTGVRPVTLAPGQTGMIDTGGIFGQGNGIAMPLLIAGVAVLALKGRKS